MRTVDARIHEEMPVQLERTVQGVTSGMQAESSFNDAFGHPVTVNDGNNTQFARQVAGKIVGEANVVTAGITMGAELDCVP